MARPPLMLLDEPSLGLAPLLVKELFEIVEKIGNEGKDGFSKALTIKEPAYA